MRSSVHRKLYESAVSEVNEEVFGHSEYGDSDEEGMPPLQAHNQIVTYDTNPGNPSSFKYYTFVVEVSPEQKKKMMMGPRNWESDDMQWFPIDEIKNHVKPLPPRTDHPEHPAYGKIHNGVAHAIHNHPYFSQTPTTPSEKPKGVGRRKKVDPNQPELF